MQKWANELYLRRTRKTKMAQTKCFTAETQVSASTVPLQRRHMLLAAGSNCERVSQHYTKVQRISFARLAHLHDNGLSSAISQRLIQNPIQKNLCAKLLDDTIGNSGN